MKKYTLIYLNIRYFLEKILVLILSPFILILFITIYLFVKSKLKKQIIFVQSRMGRNRKPFNIYKFRTMDQGIVIPELKFLRLHRIDEIPQFLNILKGDMSLIGPRPEPVEYYYAIINEYPQYAERYDIKPGLTGLAQVKYKHTTSVNDAFKKLDFDMKYLNTLSPILDIKILFNTIDVVVTQKGAA